MNMQDSYANLEKIGSGGGGTVFRAWHVRMQKDVVLKKIHDRIRDNVDIRGELDILKSLKHTYLPTVLDFLESEDAVYTVMDYIPGESFDKLIKSGRHFSQAQIVKYAGQLGEVLVYLHGQKVPIIHGDIKPANIMLTPEDNICLIDFNISQLQGGNYGKNMGYSPGFSPPEQICLVQEMKGFSEICSQNAASPEVSDGVFQSDSTVPSNSLSVNGDTTVPSRPRQGQQRDTILSLSKPQRNKDENNMEAARVFTPLNRLDERSDLYSVGATLYAILTGTAPKVGSDGRVSLDKLQEDCSEGLIRLIGKCLEPQPENRFQNAQDYLKAIQNLGKVDKRYHRLMMRQEAEILLCIVGIAGCVAVSLLGWECVQEEKEDLYSEWVQEMVQIRTTGSGDGEAFEKFYEQAVSTYPDHADAYCEKARMLYETRCFPEMIDYIQREALLHMECFSGEELANLYYLLASGYLEQGDAENAAAFYKTALQYNPYEGVCYSDYAIVLAQMGNISGAQEALNEAVEIGLADDKLLLAKGELFGRQGSVKEAEECFSQCLAITEDSYIKLRAYIMWSNLYETKPATEAFLRKKAKVLEEAAEQVTETDRPVVLEQLAQCYIDLGDETGEAELSLKAVDVLQKIVKMGWDTYLTHNNIGILYEKTQDYEAAQKEYTDMLTKYGEDYRTYKRLSFLEIEIQSLKTNEEREYQTFLRYYNRAKELFEQSGVRSDEDMEIHRLEQVYAQLQEGNWFSEEEED